MTARARSLAVLPVGQRVGEVNRRQLLFLAGQPNPFPQRHAEALQIEAHLHVRHHERSGQYLETENPVKSRRLDLLADQRVAVLLPEGLLDALEHRDDVRPRAGAGVEHVDVVAGQPVGQPELGAQHGVHPLDHVVHHLRRRVPDAQLLAEIGIEGLKERLVEVLNRVLFAEHLEESLVVDPAERRRRPVDNLDEFGGAKARRRVDELEQYL